MFGLPGAGANVTSHAGYLTVNKEFNSNMFFWFFECKVSRSESRAGPGAE